MTERSQPEQWQVSIPDLSLTLKVSEAETLLSGLQEAGVPVRHACRNGNCEICEADLLQGTVHQSYPEKQLTGNSSDPSVIRLCTSFALSDLQLRLMPYALRKSSQR